MSLSSRALGGSRCILLGVPFLSPYESSSSAVILLGLFLLVAPNGPNLSLARIWSALAPVGLSSCEVGGIRCILSGFPFLSRSGLSSSAVLLLGLFSLVASMGPNTSPARIWSALAPMGLSYLALGGTRFILSGFPFLSPYGSSSSAVLLLGLSFLYAPMGPP